jgi:RNA-directed DNA polymerase
MSDGVVQVRDRGTPQGGPLSPLLANVPLDEVDKELERRSHCFVRYADDANVYVRSRRSGDRAMALLRRLYDRLNLTINESKSAVAGVFGRRFLGHSLWVARCSSGQTQGGGKAAGDVQAACASTDAA